MPTESDAFFFGHCIGRTLDGVASREKLLDQRGLRVDGVVEIVGMCCAASGICFFSRHSDPMRFDSRCLSMMVARSGPS